MSYLNNYTDHSQVWSDREIKEYLKNNSSIVKQDGKNIQFHKRVMLDNTGKPIPVELFLALTGARVMLTHIIKETLSIEDKSSIKRTKNEWNNAHKPHKCVIAHTFRSIPLAVEMSTALNAK